MTVTTSTLSPQVRVRLDAVYLEPEILARWPEYKVLVIVAEGIASTTFARNDSEATSPLSRAETEIRSRGDINWTTDPHVAEWMEAFKSFGAKPKKTSPSSLALLRRVNDGLPRIDPLTDMYNAISISHRLPIGGEDFDAYNGPPRLGIAIGSEPFDTIAGGEPVTEYPIPGEVIWRDDIGVTCRRWNWRQGVRTRIVPATNTAFFLLEALLSMSTSELQSAGDELISGLSAISPGVSIGRRLISS